MAEINLQKRVVYAGDVHIALLKAGWSIREACDFVNGLPKADVTEVRHGYWKLIGADKQGRGGEWKCMADGCGKLYPYKCNFCPNCGARMDLGGADNGE